MQEALLVLVLPFMSLVVLLVIVGSLRKHYLKRRFIRRNPRLVELGKQTSKNGEISE